MGNLGAGEYLPAYLIKRENITDVNTYIKDTAGLEMVIEKGLVTKFRYRYLTSSEMLMQPIQGWLKSKYTRTIYTSETNITFRENDKVLMEDFMTNGLLITSKLPQTQQGMFLNSGKHPHILGLE